MKKRKVLIFACYYEPAVKGGGPIQSIKNLVDNLYVQYDFYIVTSDRDLGDNAPFSSIKIDEWVKVGHANVYYTDSKKLSFRKIISIIKSIDYDVIYLNSFFSFKFSIKLILLKKLNFIKTKVVLAPRGEFSQGALSLKSLKKKFYIKIVKFFSLYNKIIWHATSEFEKKDIQTIMGNNIDVTIANNLTANYSNLVYDKDIEKLPGVLRIIFISRITPKKNLKRALELMHDIKGKIFFSIYGPIEDQNYWLECQKVIKKLPSNIKVIYKGIIDHDKINHAFRENHIFLFPTLGENFGHVISEALIGGCPIIISDQTPWRSLEKNKVGWDIKLDDVDGFLQAIQYCVDLNNNEYKILSRNAFNFVKEISNNENEKEKYNKLFYKIK